MALQLYQALQNMPMEQYTKASSADPTVGGQHGYMAEFGQMNNSTPYIPQNVVARLIAAPRAFDLYQGNAEKLYSILKSIVELHPVTINGLDSTVTLDTASVPFGHSGQELHVAARASRARSTPQHEYNDVGQRSIANFLEWWATELFMDPDTQMPNILTRGFNLPSGSLTIAFRTATVLYFEPDPTWTRPVNAWLCANWFPTSGLPSRQGKRDQQSSLSPLNFTLETQPITDSGNGALTLAQKMMDEMLLTRDHPMFRAPVFDSVDPSVVKGYGIQDQLDAIKKEEANVRL